MSAPRRRPHRDGALQGTTSVTRPAAKSAKDYTKKERGKEHVWVQHPKRLRLGDQLRDVRKAVNPSHKGDNGR